MGVFGFIKNAGQKLFGKDHEEQQAVDPAAANQAASQAIADYIAQMGLTANGLEVAFDGSDSSVTVTGEAADAQTKEKILLCAGNVEGVANVNDNMTCAAGVEETRFYEVQSGDTLSKIAKEVFGDPNRYPEIFEANKPMLSSPDRIYPGQSLRIPQA